MVNDTVHHREPQPCTLIAALRREVRFEDHRSSIGIHTASGIRHRNHNGVTDDGVKHLVRLRDLSEVWLYGTAVTDESVARLVELPRLTKLDLARTQVTARSLPLLGGVNGLTNLRLDGLHLKDDDLAVLTGPDDLVISSAFGSQLIAQLIEQPERPAVLLELYGGVTSIRMIRCDSVGLVGAVTMGEIVAATYDLGVLAIGWHCTGDGSVVLNANVDTSVTLAADDELVVVG